MTCASWSWSIMRRPNQIMTYPWYLLFKVQRGKSPRSSKIIKLCLSIELLQNLIKTKLKKIRSLMRGEVLLGHHSILRVQSLERIETTQRTSPSRIGMLRHSALSYLPRIPSQALHHLLAWSNRLHIGSFSKIKYLRSQQEPINPSMIHTSTLEMADKALIELVSNHLNW